MEIDTLVDTGDAPATGVAEMLLPAGFSNKVKKALNLQRREYTAKLNRGNNIKKVIGHWAEDMHQPLPKEVLDYIQPGRDGSTLVDARAVFRALGNETGDDPAGWLPSFVRGRGGSCA